MHDLDPRSVLGRWELVSKSFFSNPIYNSGTMNIAYNGGRDLDYKYSGELIMAGQCSVHSGHARQHHDSVYRFVYNRDATSLVKFLYADADHMILLECRDGVVADVCPEKRAAIFIFSRQYNVSDDVIDALMQIVRERTYNCFDMKKVQVTIRSTCPASTPAGKTSCTFSDVAQLPFIDMTSLAGVWYLTGRTHSSLYQWDSGILHVTHEGHGRATMTYTGLADYQSQQCLGPYEVRTSVAL